MQTIVLRPRRQVNLWGNTGADRLSEFFSASVQPGKAGLGFPATFFEVEAVKYGILSQNFLEKHIGWWRRSICFGI